MCEHGNLLVNKYPPRPILFHPCPFCENERLRSRLALAEKVVEAARALLASIHGSRLTMQPAGEGPSSDFPAVREAIDAFDAAKGEGAPVAWSGSSREEQESCPSSPEPPVLTINVPSVQWVDGPRYTRSEVEALLADLRERCAEFAWDRGLAKQAFKKVSLWPTEEPR